MAFHFKALNHDLTWVDYLNEQNYDLLLLEILPNFGSLLRAKKVITIINFPPDYTTMVHVM